MDEEAPAIAGASAVLPREEDRRFSQDLPLHPQPRVLIAQPRKLLALIARQTPRTLATNVLLLPDPTAKRDIGDPQILRQPALRLITKLGEPNRLRRNSSGYGGRVLGT